MVDRLPYVRTLGSGSGSHDAGPLGDGADETRKGLCTSALPTLTRKPNGEVPGADQNGTRKRHLRAFRAKNVRIAQDSRENRKVAERVGDVCVDSRKPNVHAGLARKHLCSRD